MNEIIKNSDTMETEAPLVSVAAISYMHANYIRKALDSVLEQKVDFKYEIVVGEDASHDGTADILLEYQNKYPEIIIPLINEKNIGASHNSYNVQLHCRGKYIAPLECDDFWCDPNRLQKQVDYLETHPELSAVGSNYYCVDHNGETNRISMTKREVSKTYYLNDYLYNGFTIHGGTLLYRNFFPLQSERYKRVRFCAPTMGDVFARCLLYDYGGIYVFPEPMHCHRDGSKDATSFTARQKTDAMKYTYMMQNIVEEMNWYFDGKYDFSPKVCTRMAAVFLSWLLGSAQISIREWQDFLMTMRLHDQIFVINRIVVFGGRKAIRKLLCVLGAL